MTTPAPEADYKSAGARWKDWVHRFWWLRGVAAAMTLAALVPKFVDVSRYEFLAAFNAVVLEWNRFCAWLGEIIGPILFLGEIPPIVVNTAIFSSAVCLPSAIAMYLDFVRFPTNIRRPVNRIEALSFWIYNKLSFLKTIYKYKSIGIFIAVTSFIWLTLIYFFTNDMMDHYSSVYHKNIVGVRQSDALSLNHILLMVGLLVVLLIYVTYKLPGYGRGLVYTVSFVLALQALYLLNTPWLADHIRSIPCELQDQPPAWCEEAASGGDSSPK